jgi:hypothetical protein
VYELVPFNMLYTVIVQNSDRLYLPQNFKLQRQFFSPESISKEFVVSELV